MGHKFRSYPQFPFLRTGCLNAVSNEREAYKLFTVSLDNHIINGQFESVRMTTKSPCWWHSLVYRNKVEKW